jgi:hypothetical protein
LQHWALVQPPWRLKAVVAAAAAVVVVVTVVVVGERALPQCPEVAPDP